MTFYWPTKTPPRRQLAGRLREIRHLWRCQLHGGFRGERKDARAARIEEARRVYHAETEPLRELGRKIPKKTNTMPWREWRESLRTSFPV